MKSKLLLVCLITFSSVCAYSQGKVGINTTSPQAMLHVKDSSVLFTGLNPLPGFPGNLPANGGGTRMMWYADKAAFRAGNISGAQWNKDSIGTYSIAMGFNTKAKASSSTALGQATNANNVFCTAMGFSTTASGHTSTSMGNGTLANGDYSTAMGLGTIASGYASTGMGNLTTASGNYSSAMGWLTTASGIGSVAMGKSTKASGSYSFASGWENMALGNYSSSLGEDTKSSGENSFASGFNTHAKSYASVVVGRFNDTTSISSSTWNALDPLFIIGNGSANNARSNAFTVLKNAKTGVNVENPQAMLHVQRDGSFGGPFLSNSLAILESGSVSYLQFSHPTNSETGILSGSAATSIRSGFVFRADSSTEIRAGGNFTKMTVDNNGNIGINTPNPLAMLHVKDSSVLFTGPLNLPGTPGNPPVSGAGTRMMWYPNKAAFRVGFVASTAWDQSNVGKYSFATGRDTKASEDYSTAFGYRTIASGFYSTAMGAETTASGFFSTAIGDNTIASGESSTAMGDYTTASGPGSTAIGTNTNASGNYSTAMGVVTAASGHGSTAMGSVTKAKGHYSTSMGVSTQANGYSSAVVGLFNDTIVSAQTSVSSTTPLFIVGNGDANNTRSNAMVVRKDGKVGIGTSSPSYLLDVGARMRLRGGGTGGTSPGIWFNKNDNSAVASFIGMFNDNHIGIYSELGAG